MKLNPFSSRASKGQQAEALARHYLEAHGLRFIEQNFNSRYGEIDLIMQHHDTLVFVEVRYRKNQDYGGAGASITPRKQNRIRNTALFYMQKKNHEFNARFDVIAISSEHGQADIDWIQNAF